MIDITHLRLLYIRSTMILNKLSATERLSAEMYETIDKRKADLSELIDKYDIPKSVLQIWNQEVNLLEHDPGSWFLYFYGIGD